MLATVGALDTYRIYDGTDENGIVGTVARGYRPRGPVLVHGLREPSGPRDALERLVRYGASETLSGAQSCQFLTVMLTPELRRFRPSWRPQTTRCRSRWGHVVVFQLHNYPKIGRRSRTEYRAVKAVDAAEQLELDAGGVRGRGIKQGRSGQRRPIGGDDHARRWGRIIDGDIDARAQVLPAELEATDDKMYEPLGTFVVFQLHNHPK